MRYLGLVIIVIASACNEPRVDAPAVLRVAIASEPPSLNPQLDPLDARSRDIAYYVYESLAVPDATTYAPTPRLAKDWVVSADHLTYTFHLRTDVKWHDGVPFTADDVVYTFEALRDPRHATSGIRAFVEPIVTVRSDGPATVVVTTATPYWYAFDAISEIYIYPKHLYANADFNTHPLNRAPVGTGPYRFATWKSGDRIVLERNRDYYGKAPRLDALQFVYVPDAPMRLQMAKNGDIDVIERLTPEQWDDVAHDAAMADKFAALRHVPDGIQWLGWNEARPMFADARVRRALTMLVDRHDIVTRLRRGLDSETASWFYPGSPDFNAELAALPFDPSAALRLLADAGWSDHDGDGVLDKDGAPLAFTLLTPTNNPLYEQLASLLTQDFARAHVNLSTAKVEWALYTERLRKHDFDACSLVVRLEPRSDPYASWHSGAPANWVGFANAEADTLLAAARADFDAAHRARLYKRFSAILAEEQPVTLLFDRYNLSLVSKRFGGVVSTPYGLFRYEDFYLVRPRS